MSDDFVAPEEIGFFLSGGSQDKIDAMTDNVRLEFDRIVSRYAEKILAFVEDCQSPIEQFFGMELYRMQSMFENFCDEGYFVLSSQEEIQKTPYRVDFFMTGRRNGETKRLVIECDGHDYHEKNKAQAKKDKKRDRELLLHGYPVVRFTGSEIVADANECVHETFQIFKSLFAGL